MKFVFINKTEYEADIITNVLNGEKILFKTKERHIPVYTDKDCNNSCGSVSLYDITCFTDFAHFEFVRNIANKKITNIKKLNKLYYSYSPNDLFDMDYNSISNDFPKRKTFLKKIFDWIFR